MLEGAGIDGPNEEVAEHLPWAHPAVKLVWATFHLTVLHLSGWNLPSDVAVQWFKMQMYSIYQLP